MSPFEKKLKEMLKEVFIAGYNYGFEDGSTGQIVNDLDIEVSFHHWYDQQKEKMLGE